MKESQNVDSQEENRLDELREIIATAGPRIEAEFARAKGNSWLSCFGNSIFVIEIELFNPELEALLPPEKYQIAMQRLEELKQRHHKLKQQYPDRETMPPEEIKQELLKGLDILREEDSNRLSELANDLEKIYLQKSGGKKDSAMERLIQYLRAGDAKKAKIFLSNEADKFTWYREDAVPLIIEKLYDGSGSPWFTVERKLKERDAQ